MSFCYLHLNLNLYYLKMHVCISACTYVKQDFGMYVCQANWWQISLTEQELSYIANIIRTPAV